MSGAVPGVLPPLLLLVLLLGLGLGLWRVRWPRRRARALLVAVCCIDPRAHELTGCLAGVRAVLARFARPGDRVCVAGVVRAGDADCHRRLGLLGAETLTVPDYPNPIFRDRHHYGGIASQRTRALTYAREHGFDAVWFVDSDIHPDPDTLVTHLWPGWERGGDVVAVPYRVRWHGATPVVGQRDAAGRPLVGPAPPPGTGGAPPPLAAAVVVGMGCTLVRTAGWGWWRVPSTFRVAECLGVRGEDVGFCLDAERRGARVWVTTDCPAPLHAGG